MNTVNFDKHTTKKIPMNIQFFAWDDVDSKSSGKSDVEYTKINSGQMITIRILDAEPFSRWTHWLPLQKRSLTCGGRNCPICAVVKAQKANNETPQYTQARKHILHVWNYDTNKIEFFEQGNAVFKDLSAFHKMLGDIRNADIKVMKSGQGKDTKYTFMPQAPSQVAPNILEQYNEKKVNFVERYTEPSVEDIKKLMSGASFDDVYGNKSNTEEPSAEDVSFVVAQ